MTVAELIEQLQLQDPRSVVVMAHDAEGNGYSRLDEIEAGIYLDWDAEFYSETDQAGYFDNKTSLPAICLWP